MIPNTVIACDVDGVIADVLTNWLARYNRDYNDNLKHDDITAWDTSIFVKAECGKKIFAYLDDPSLYDDVLPYPGALDAVKELKKLGRVVYATSSPAKSYGRKFFWLKEHGFLSDQLDYFETRDKSLVRADFLIDDYYKNLDTFVGKKILLAQPWNYSLEKDPDYVYGTSWKKIIGYIKNDLGL
jgi:5'(3')-deoxyribonucleotidase